jgi:hypothetical protein
MLPAYVAAQEPPKLLLGASDQSIRVSAANGKRWPKKNDAVVWLDGPCYLQSGETMVTAQNAILWLSGGDKPGQSILDVYAEKNVKITRNGVIKPQTTPFYARISTEVGMVFSIEKFTAIEKEGKEEDENKLYIAAFKVRYPGQLPPGSILPLEGGLLTQLGLQFYAQSYSFETKENVTRAILHGDARVDVKGSKLYADNIVAWMQQAGSASASGTGGSWKPLGVYAEGSVLYITADQTVRADAMYVDMVTYEGIATNAVVRSNTDISKIPFTFASGEVRILDQHNVFAAEGFMSTCEYSDPHYGVKGHDILITSGSPKFEPDGQQKTGVPPLKGAPKRKATATTPESVVVSSLRNVFYLGPVPVFYWPYVAHDIQSGGFLLRSISFEGNSRTGPVFRTAWNPYDLGVYRNDWSEATLHLDYYFDHGMAFGLDFEYEGPTRVGFITTYFLSDSEDKSFEGTPFDSGSRGRFLWRHREFLDYNWRADIEVSYLSDATFLPQFFQQEFENGKEQETLIYLRKIDDNRMYTGLLSMRINDFQNYVERQPELGFYWLGQPIWGDRVVWTTRNTLSYLHLRQDEGLGVDDPNATFRVDSSHELAIPLRFSWLQVEPFVGVDVTGYSNQADSDSATVRIMAAYGVRAAAEFYRTYVAESEFFNVHGIRHIFNPSFTLQHVFLSSRPHTDFTQYDQVDARDEVAEAILRLHNRFQTKRGKPDNMESVDFLTVDLDLHLFANEKLTPVATSPAFPTPPQFDNYVELNAAWLLNDHWKVTTSRTRFNLDQGQFDVLNGGITMTYWQPVKISVEQDMIKGQFGGPDRSITTLKVGYKPKGSRWELEFEEKYDWNGKDVATGHSDNNPKNLSTALAFSRDLHCWRLTISLTLNQAAGGGGGTGFGFKLTPILFTGKNVEL